MIPDRRHRECYFIPSTRHDLSFGSENSDGTLLSNGGLLRALRCVALRCVELIEHRQGMTLLYSRHDC